MTVSKLGIAHLPGFINRAPGDIKHRLWSLYWLVRLVTRDPRSRGGIVECGTRGGDSTRALLAACADEDTHLNSYDIENCDSSVQEPFLRERWIFNQMDSISAAKAWGSEITFDLVFIDTDHTYATTQAEIAAWSRHLRVGGCLVFHDYWLYDPPRDEHAGRGVKMAVDEWCNARPDAWKLETWDACGDGDTGIAVIWRIK